MKLSITVGQRIERKEPKMALIYVKAKPGRIAYSAPRGGKVIPTDEFMAVTDTPYIRRLIEVHEDVELQAETKPAAAQPAAPAAPAAPVPPPTTPQK